MKITCNEIIALITRIPIHDFIYPSHDHLGTKCGFFKKIIMKENCVSTNDDYACITQHEGGCQQEYDLKYILDMFEKYKKGSANMVLFQLIKKGIK